MKRWSKAEIRFLKAHQHLSRKELAAHFRVSEQAVRRIEQRLNLPVRKLQLEGSQPNRIGITERMNFEREITRLKDNIQGYKEREKELQRQIATLQEENVVAAALAGFRPRIRSKPLRP